MIKFMTKNFLRAIATLTGTIVGVGMLGLPYLAEQSGLITILFYFLFLGASAILIQMAYSEVVLKTKGDHQLAGYVAIHLGRSWRGFTSIVFILGLLGALLAYVVVGGQILFLALSPFLGGTLMIYTAVNFILAALFIFRGSKMIARGELLMIGFMIGVVFLLFFFNLIKISASNFNLSFGQNLFLPYGAIVFSLWGSSAIPIIKKILAKEAVKIRSVTLWSVLISILIYLIFIITVGGLLGAEVKENALDGIAGVLPTWLTILTLLLGYFAVFTSFISLGDALKENFSEDYKISYLLSWLLAISIPLAMFLAGFQDFLFVISITGAVALGIFGVIMGLLYLKTKKLPLPSNAGRPLNLPNWLVYMLITIFLLGAVGEIYFSVTK